MCRTIEVAKDKVGGERGTQMWRLDQLCLRSLDPSGSEAFRGGSPAGDPAAKCFIQRERDGQRGVEEGKGRGGDPVGLSEKEN